MPQMNSKTKLSKAIACLNFALFLFSCSKGSLEASYKGGSISEDQKFGTANLTISQGDFEKLGFSLGDSCDVAFSNGASYSDVPYYNGYYVKNGDPVIVAYPSSDYLLITLNNVGIWEEAKLDESYTVDITLKEKGKYLPIQQTLGQSYSLDRSAYSSDEEFSNFRALQGGKLKKSLIYRGASPFDNSRKRASTSDALLEKNLIQSIVDLADGEGDMNYYLSQSDFASPYSRGLYRDGKVALLGMGSSYMSLSYKQSVANGIRHMLGTPSPYYIHCMEGKDRTGFVCMLIEALAGASYQEMESDYMKTYENYYKVSKEKDKEKYEAIKSLYFDSFCQCLYGEEDEETLKKASYIEPAKNYLSEGGLSESEISSFISLICD